MDQYRLIEKIIKSKACTYYRAEHNTTKESVLIKKINKLTTWEELLKNRDLALMKADPKLFPATREIVKSQDRFYVVMEKPDKNLQLFINSDISKEEVFKISRLLIQFAMGLASKNIYPREIRPVHLFVSENMHSLKMAHLQTHFKDICKLDLVELQDLRYLSPEQVLTTKQIDERSLVFNIGLIICDLILGKSLITANTKMHYIYELCRLFPEQDIGGVDGSEHHVRQQHHEGDEFEKIIRKYNFSNEFIALLKQMFKLDRNQRISMAQLLEAFDVIVSNEQNHQKGESKKHMHSEIQAKPNGKQYPINDQIDFELSFQAEQKPTLSTIPIIRTLSTVLPVEKNVDDQVAKPIVIRQSLKQGVKNRKLNTTKDSEHRSKMTPKQPSLNTIKKPQLTNYALNYNNLGVKMGMNPTIFSEHDI